MKYYLLWWGNQGFDMIKDITEEAPENRDAVLMQAALEGTKAPVSKLGSLIHKLGLRARFNVDMEYECYVIKADETIELDDLEDMAENTPQYLVDFARREGTPVIEKTPVRERKIV